MLLALTTLKRFQPMRLFSALALLMILVGGAPARAGMDEARAALARRDFAAAVSELQPLAEAGNAEAQSELGTLFFRGLGVPQDDAAAARWERLAADQGFAPAQASLGALTMTGRGVAKDPAEAVRLLRASAAQGNADAMFSLGHCAAEGLGMPRSATEAERWYRQSADKGNAQGENALGMLLWNGADGVPADRVQAVSWFKRAAARGLGPSQYNLGKAYEAGIGVPQNLSEAYFWLSLAAAQAPPGQPWAAERDAVAARLPPQELAAIQQKAGQFRPLPSGAALRADATTGTGFFVAHDGVLLTNSHVVDGCRHILVGGAAGKDSGATLLARDAANDLALLRTAIRPQAVASFRADPPVRPGDAVVVIGFPLSGMLSKEPIVTEGSVSALAGVNGDERFLQMAAPLQRGNSGGPVLDLAGNVVGIATAKLNALAIASATGDLPQNVNFALKSAASRRFLEANGVSYELSPSLREARPADVADRARAYVAAVECRH